MRCGNKPQNNPVEDQRKRMKRIVEALRLGNYRNTSARAAGCAYDTFRVWLRRGEAAIKVIEEGGSIPATEEIYEEFARDVIQAEADVETERVARIDAAAKSGDVKWDAWMLEHGPSKERFATRSELTGPDGGAIETRDASLTPAEIEQNIIDIVTRAANRG